MLRQVTAALIKRMINISYVSGALMMNVDFIEFPGQAGRRDIGRMYNPGNKEELDLDIEY